MGLMIESTAMARACSAGFGDHGPGGSYAVRLDAANHLRWHIRDDDGEHDYRTEPGTSWWRRAGVRLLLENHPQGLLARAETIDAFLAREGYDDIAVIYDVANALAAGEDAGQVYLDVTLAAAVTDIFVEGKAMHFFATPVWRDEGLRARLPVHGARNADELKGSPLRITLDVGGAGLEQTLTVV